MTGTRPTGSGTDRPPLAADAVHLLVQVHYHADVVGDHVYTVADLELPFGARHFDIAVLLVHFVEPGAGGLYQMPERHL